MTANTLKRLETIEIPHGNPITHSVIWLHGLGADGSDFAPIIPELRLPAHLGIRFIFPHAPIMPITINNGYEMRAWYDIISLTRESEIDKDGILRSVTDVATLIETEIERGIASKNIILAGFSQGAAIALTAGLRCTNQLGGVIALSGYLPMMDETLSQASSANQSLPLFIAHGTEDQIVPYALGKSTYVALKQAGYPIDWHTYPMPHSVCAEEIADISLWIQKVVQ